VLPGRCSRAANGCVPLSSDPKLAFTMAHRWRTVTTVAPPRRSRPNSFCFTSCNSAAFASRAATRAGGSGIACVPRGVGLGCRSGRRNWRCGCDGCSVRGWRIRRCSCRGSRGGGCGHVVNAAFEQRDAARQPTALRSTHALVPPGAAFRTPTERHAAAFERLWKSRSCRISTAGVRWRIQFCS
jgi:hypothetical protein